MLAALKVLRPATRPTPVDLARGQRGGIEFFSFAAIPTPFSLSLSLSLYFCFFSPPVLVSLFSAGGIFGLASDSRAASLKREGKRKSKRERERERERSGDEDRAPSLLRGATKSRSGRSAARLFARSRWRFLGGKYRSSARAVA